MNNNFRVRINKQDQSQEKLHIGMKAKIPDNSVIHLVPIVEGSKSGGLFSVIAGAALIVAGVVLWSTPFGIPLVVTGAGLMLGGVAMMLTKLPPMNEANDGSKNNNTSFSSLDNSIAQGSCVPLCYGEVMTGSKVLSQGLEAL